MFSLTLDGFGPYEIARKFMDEKIVKPNIYFSEHGLVNGNLCPRARQNDDYGWSGGVVAQYLAKPEYGRTHRQFS
jgi:hypothetical protein